MVNYDKLHLALYTILGFSITLFVANLLVLVLAVWATRNEHSPEKNITIAVLIKCVVVWMVATTLSSIFLTVVNYLL